MSTVIFELWHKACIAAGITFIAMLVLIPLAYRFRLLDFPAGRKDHAIPTPVIGGLAMGIGIAGSEILRQINNGVVDQGFLAYSAGGALLIAIGQLDDKYDLPWWARICAQAIAALIPAVWAGVRIEHLGPLFGSAPIALGAWSVPFTVFATVGLVNAINMIDGMDGFAGSLGLTALVMLAAAALYSGNTALTADIATICGALLSFLYFNFRFPWRNRAQAFLGNGGSAFLGFTVAWVAFRLTQTSGHPVTPSLALWLIPVPLVDCLVLIVQRIRKGNSPFKADQNHLHHLMREAGIQPMRTVVIVCLFSLITGLTAALALRAGFQDGLLLGAFFALAAVWYWLTAKRNRALALLRPLSGISRRRKDACPISHS